ncbi:hypothetical protein FRX31_024634, partial [Thalictrum thalictroides]
MAEGTRFTKIETSLKATDGKVNEISENQHTMQGDLDKIKHQMIEMKEEFTMISQREKSLDEIKHQMQMFQPKEMDNVIAIARLQEAVLESINRVNKGNIKPFSTNTGAPSSSFGNKFSKPLQS